MQNFTFGRKGLNWFLFAFILFVGNLSASYAQNCPTLDPGDETQSFCYLSRVSDLEANPNGDGVRWYRTNSSATSTTPIPEDEILQDGSYFAGNESGDCATREEVVVTVDDLGPPTSTFGNFFEPCEYSSEDFTTVGELKDLITPSSPTFEINVYDQSQEYGTVALNDTDPLIDGRSYFIGQDDPATLDCEYSSRIAIRYAPVLATAPAAEPVQTFCESATVADLEAEGINRWYSTMTSNPALDPSTPLVDGQTYYASQIVNRTGSSLPPCESQDRTAVLVSLTDAPDAGEDSAGIVCFPDVEATFPSFDEIRNYLLTLLEPGVPITGTFSPTASELAGIYASDADGLGDFTTTYTVGSGSCTDSVDLTISVVAVTPANAGDFNDVTDVCTGDAIIDLSTLPNNDPDATMGGTFSGTGVTANQFDPSVGAGVYTIRYDVDETSAPCTSGSDFTEFTITVREADAGEDGSVTLSSTDAPVNLFDYLEGTPDMGGTWSPGDGTFDPATDAPGDYMYTVTDPSCGSDSAIVTVTVITCATPPDAGEDNIGIVCLPEVGSTFPSVDETRKFFLDLLEEGVSRTGSFSPTITEIIEIYNDDADGLGDFTVTYTIGTPDCGDSVDLTVRVIEETAANAGDFDDVPAVCSGSSVIDLTTLINNDPEATMGGTFSGTGVSANQFDPSIGAGVYTITYDVDETSAPCITGTSSTDFTVTVEQADAGEDGTVTLSSTDDPVNLFDYLNGTPDMGGTWSPGDGTFDPASDTPGDFVYTVTGPTCGSDSATVTVIISDCPTPPNAGADNFGIVCFPDVEATFPSVDETRKYFLDLLDADVSRTGTFNPTISQLIEQYNADADGLGDFTTTYTVGTVGCQDSADLTVRVVEVAPANAGDFDNITDVCSNEDMIDLDMIDNNDSEATIGGTFSGAGVTDNMFDPSVGAGTYTITYTVDDTTPCTTGSDSTTFDITVEDAPVSADLNRTLCITEAETLLADDTALQAYLLNLLDEAGVDTFDAAGFDVEDLLEGQRLLNFIDTPTSDSQTFNFSYIDESTSASCEDGTINIAITVNDVQDAEAGTIDDQRVCESDGMVDLSTYLGSDSMTGGTFSGMSVSGGMFDTSIGANDDGYEITYTVDDSIDCTTPGTSDSETFTIFVDTAVEAGADNSGDVCRANVDDLFPNEVSVRNYYLALLSDGVATDGTFSPSIVQLITTYNTNPDQDVFTTTYTVSNGGCTDSVDLTINVYDSIPAEIGDIDDQTYCRNDVDVTLTDLLPAGANPNGTFEGYEDGTFSPGMAGAGNYTINYTLTDDSPCTEGTATATFTITVTEAAYAGMDVTVPATCTNEEALDLNGSISADADADGEFTFQDSGDVIEDGILDVSTLATGTYAIVYTVAEINDCGEDTAILTLNISEAPAGPTVDGDPFTFCAVDGPVGADLSATGTNLTFYSDEDLTMMVMDDDALVSGTYYVTQRSDEGGCESNATSFTVTVNDADTPTISSTSQEFCEYDDATIADLTSQINETGTITWYDSADGDNALSEGTPLQDGVTYYATLFDVDSGCESSTRLAVSVSLTDCPLLFPEGFSPNGDGLNDTFDIENIEDEYPNYTIEIRNRFGDVVYKGNANTPEWDGFSSEGSFGDNVLPVGAYFYYLDFKDGSTEPRRGTVYLSR